MRHIDPPRWADALDGKVSMRERAAIEAHADKCARCARVRDRVLAARAALRTIGDSVPPTPGWDLLGSSVSWSQAAPRRAPRRLWPVALTAGAALTAAIATALLVRAPETVTRAPSPSPAPATVPSPAPLPAPAPSPLALEAVVTYLQGDVRVNGAKATADSTLAAGTVLETGRGRLAVQFGPGSGLVLEPQSRLEVAAFDSTNIVVRVSGAVDVELEHRLPGQRFAVVAGARTVEVRGTVFRVAHHAGDLDVAVRTGRVAIIEGDDQIEVSAGARLALSRGLRVGSILPEPMLRATAQALSESMRVPLVPGWTGDGAAALRASSSVLSIAVAPGARVKVDGVDTGVGSFILRAPPGRHLVESGTTVRWIEAEGGEVTVAALSASRSERPSQVDAQLRVHRSDVGFCAETERKAAPGFEGAVEVEIGIGADGSVNFVSLVRASVAPDVNACIQDLIRDRFTFPSGSQATVRKAINF